MAAKMSIFTDSSKCGVRRVQALEPTVDVAGGAETTSGKNPSLAAERNGGVRADAARGRGEA
jgi:hypothetical protein